MVWYKNYYTCKCISLIDGAINKLFNLINYIKLSVKIFGDSLPLSVSKKICRSALETSKSSYS